MRKSLKSMAAAAVIASGAAAVLIANAPAAEARSGFFLGIALPPLYLGPPAYAYPPPAYYQPPAYYAPPPGYYAPPPQYAPPCRARYDWRWDGYSWRRAYVGCW